MGCSRTFRLLVLCSLAVLSAPLRAQNLLYDLSVPMDPVAQQSVGACGDVNGDGFQDFLVGHIGDDSVATNAGVVRLHSGRDAEVLFEVFGAKLHEQMGYAVDGAGDVDADGFPDFMGGAGKTLGNVARVWSGADGSLLRQVSGAPYDFFGNDVCGLGDADLDGFDDFAAAAPQDESSHPGKGYVRAYSGASGALLQQWVGDCLYSEFGTAIDGPGDVNGDGFPELTVYQSGWSCPQSVRVFTPLGALLHTLPADGTILMYHYAVAGAADMDGDGLREILVGNPGDPTCTGASPGNMRAYSGLSGALLLDIDGEPGCTSLGNAVDGAGDVNGDGFEDVAAAVVQEDRVDVYSSLDESLLLTFESTDPNYAYGMAGLGDLNGDGWPEIGVVASAAGAWIQSTCPGVVVSYGGGCEGSNDFTPKLAVTGCPNPGGTLVVHATQGFGGQPAFLAVGSGQGYVPLGGGCALIATPLLFVAPLGLLSDFGPGLGERDVPILIPPSAQGATFTFQVANADPFVPMGFAVSNGVRIDVL
jgi:hypothetical protein